MDPHQAAHAARMLKVRQVIPMHYGTFPALTGRPEDLSEKLKKDGIQVLTMEPGQTIQW
jgi:L-ascorbate metabolism protein UlaG (beta-lactamase superfamily)